MLTLFDSKNFYEAGEGADKLRGKLTLLGKTRDTVVRDWKSTEGFGSKLAGFFTSQGSKDAQAQIDSDVAALKELQKLYDNTKIKKDFDQKDAIAATLSSASEAARTMQRPPGRQISTSASLPTRRQRRPPARWGCSSPPQR